MNWIEESIIDNKLQQITKDFFELGKEFFKLKNDNKLNLDFINKKYGFSKNKVYEYINNYQFIKKFNIKNYEKIGIRKLNLLKKINNTEIIKKLISKENLTEKEILNEIENLKERRIYKKVFNLTNEEKELFENIKEKLEKEFDNNKITNSQLFSYILHYFNIHYFN